MLPIISEHIKSMGFTRSITTQKFGTHHFCFINNDNFKSKVSFQVVVGKHANDYGSPVGTDNLIDGLGNQARIAE